MPFLAKGARTYKGRVHDSKDEPFIVTMGTRDYDTAVAIEAFGQQLRDERRYRESVLDAIVHEGKFTIADAYDHRGSPDKNGVREELDAWLAEVTAVNLDDLVKEWKPSVEGTEYYRQVRVLIREGKRFPITEFRRGRLSRFLKGLPVGVVTRRKYKVALSAFAKFLIEGEHVPEDWTNPVRDVDLGKVPDDEKVAIIYLEPAEVQQLVKALPTTRQRALEALMAGTMMEWQSCHALHGRDINFERRLVLAKGEKNKYRTRWVEFTEDWAWEIFSEYALGEQFNLRPNARLFHPMAHDHALQIHHDTAEKLGLRYTTLHHHRHSYAVMWIRDKGAVYGKEPGRDLSWLRNQAGHAPNSQMINTTYAVHIQAAKLTLQQEARLTGAPKKRAKGVARR